MKDGDQPESDADSNPADSSPVGDGPVGDGPVEETNVAALELLHRINEICERFENTLQDSPTQHLEAFLTDWPDVQRRQLFRYLLELEVDYGLRRGVPVSEGSCRERFPAYGDIIERVFARVAPETKQGTLRESTVYQDATAVWNEAGVVDNAGTGRQGQAAIRQGIFPGAMLANRYRIVALLGRGGMGEVYRADDLKLGEPIALKLLPRDVEREPQRLALLTNEVRLARKIAHPNVCRVYDIGQSDRVHFLSMEFIDGEDLRSLLSRIGPLPIAKVMELTHHLCFGLAAAHERGVVHRDLKPANVMIDGRGRAKITDFGLASPADEQQAAAAHAGTPMYMAPEQFFDNKTSVQSDLYALGLVIHEMLTGSHPYPAGSRSELQRSLAQDLPQISLDSQSEQESLLREAVRWCLQRHVGDRPPSALAVSARLPGGDPLAAAIALGDTPSPEQVAAAQNVNLPSPRTSWVCFALTIVGLLVVIGLWHELSSKMRLQEAPQALASRTRELLADLVDERTRPVDVAFGYSIDRDYLSYLAKHDVPWDQLSARTPSPIYFWYRSSPQLLAPRIPDWTGESFLLVDQQRPAFDVPGMIRAQTSLSGELTRLEVLPRESSPTDDDDETTRHDHSNDVEWVDRLLDASLLGASRLGANRAEQATASPLGDQNWTEVDPQRLPPGYADQRRAWVAGGVFEELGERQVRVEAAALNQQVVYFEMIGQGWRGSDSRPPQIAESGSLRAMILLIWLPILIGAGAMMAGRNWRRGRSDPRNAKRLAHFMFVVTFAVCLLKDRHVLDGVELDLLISALAASVLMAGFIWCSYIALEPDARRFWPRTLIGWTRLMSGRYRDPVVGFELLIGAGMGVGVGLLKLLNALVPLWFDAASDSFVAIVNFEPLMGMRQTVAEFLAAIGFAVFYSFFTQLLFLLLLRFAFGNNLRAAIAYVGFLSLLVASQHHQFLLAFSLTAIEMSLTAALFMRCGLLAVVSMHFVRLLLKWPMTMDLGWWGADAGCFAIVSVALLASGGLYLFLQTHHPRGRSPANNLSAT